MPELSEKARLVADRYEDLYFRRNGKTVTVKCTSPGWYTILHEGYSIVNSFQRHRLSEIETMSSRLEEMVAELETASKRKGFIVKIAPPLADRYKNPTCRYYVADGKWTSDRTCSSVFVFNGAHEADSVAHEVNEGLPFKYAEYEPF